MKCLCCRQNFLVGFGHIFQTNDSPCLSRSIWQCPCENVLKMLMYSVSKHFSIKMESSYSPLRFFLVNIMYVYNRGKRKMSPFKKGSWAYLHHLGASSHEFNHDNLWIFRSQWVRGKKKLRTSECKKGLYSYKLKIDANGIINSFCGMQ